MTSGWTSTSNERAGSWPDALQLRRRWNDDTNVAIATVRLLGHRQIQQEPRDPRLRRAQDHRGARARLPNAPEASGPVDEARSACRSRRLVERAVDRLAAKPREQRHLGRVARA